MKATTISSNAPPQVDMNERRLLFDTSWPLALIIMTAAYVLSWSLDLLRIELSTVLWTTFGLALGHQTLSRLLDFVDSRQGLMQLHAAINIAAIVGLAAIWSLLGGLAAPAFAMFFALPVIALGLVSSLALQFGITAFAVLCSWTVALRESAELRLQLEQLGFPPVWNAVPGLTTHEFAGYGVIASGSAQLQFMLVFTFAMVGVVTTSAVVVALITRLFDRLRFVSVSGRRAEKMAQSFMTQEDGLELIVDRKSFQVIAVSPRLAGELEEPPETLIGCHYTTVLPFSQDHPALRMIEAGVASELTQQVFPAPSGYKLVNIRIHPGTSDGFEFQRVTLEDLQQNDYAQIAVDGLEDLAGVVDGGGRILYLSQAVKKLLPVMHNEWRADLLPLPAGWWEIGARHRHTRKVSIGYRDFELQLSRNEIFADEGNLELTSFRLLPARGE